MRPEDGKRWFNFRRRAAGRFRTMWLRVCTGRTVNRVRSVTSSNNPLAMVGSIVDRAQRPRGIYPAGSVHNTHRDKAERADKQCSRRCDVPHRSIFETFESNQTKRITALKIRAEKSTINVRVCSVFRVIFSSVIRQHEVFFVFDSKTFSVKSGLTSKIWIRNVTMARTNVFNLV